MVVFQWKMALVFLLYFIDFVSVVLYNIFNIGTERMPFFQADPTAVSETAKEAMTGTLDQQGKIPIQLRGVKKA